MLLAADAISSSSPPTPNVGGGDDVAAAASTPWLRPPERKVSGIAIISRQKLIS